VFISRAGIYMTWTRLQPTSVSLRTRTEVVLETSVLSTFNCLTQLEARENFVKLSCRESLKSYINKRSVVKWLENSLSLYTTILNLSMWMLQHGVYVTWMPMIFQNQHIHKLQCQEKKSRKDHATLLSCALSQHWTRDWGMVEELVTFSVHQVAL
jgi:hypothetical protein